MIYFSIYGDSFAEVKDTVDRLIALGYTNICARFDGKFDGQISSFLAQNKVKCTYTSNIKQDVGGGANTHCYLGMFLTECSDTHLIKIDPDTLPLRKLYRLPINAIGCNYQHKRYCVYGGCIVFPRSVAARIHDSKLLLDDKYKDKAWHYGNRRLRKRIPSNDMILYDVLLRMKIPIDTMQEQVHCIGKTDNPNYCFIHPKNAYK